MLTTDSGKGLLAFILSHSAFKEDPATIGDALGFLSLISERVEATRDGDLGVGYKTIQNAFRGKPRTPPEYRDALIELGLLIQTKKAVPPTMFAAGKVARFTVTDRFVQAFNKASFEFVSQYNGKRAEMGSTYAAKGRMRLLRAKNEGAFIRAHELLANKVELVDWERLECRRDDEEVLRAEAFALC